MRRAYPVIGWIEIDDVAFDRFHEIPAAESMTVLVANLAELTRELRVEWQAVLERSYCHHATATRVAVRAGLG